MLGNYVTFILYMCALWQIRPYVNGALYSILGISAVREAAREMVSGQMCVCVCFVCNALHQLAFSVKSHSLYRPSLLMKLLYCEWEGWMAIFTFISNLTFCSYSTSTQIHLQINMRYWNKVPNVSPVFWQSMEEILCCYSKEENPELNRQIEFIIKQLNSGRFHQSPYVSMTTEYKCVSLTLYSVSRLCWQ